MSNDEIVTMCEKIRAKYPDTVLHETVKEIQKEQLERYESHINTFRAEYKKRTDFHARKGYYLDVLQKMEQGYELAKKRMQENLIVKPYEAWINEHIILSFKRKGFKEGVRHELLFGNLT